MYNIKINEKVIKSFENFDEAKREFFSKINKLTRLKTSLILSSEKEGMLLWADLKYDEVLGDQTNREILNALVWSIEEVRLILLEEFNIKVSHYSLHLFCTKLEENVDYKKYNKHFVIFYSGAKKMIDYYRIRLK